MDDLISRQVVIELIANYDLSMGQVVNAIHNIPSAYPKIGKWIHRNDDYTDWLECSECEYGSEGEVKFGYGTNFCPSCGAKMEGMQNEN